MNVAVVAPAGKVNGLGEIVHTVVGAKVTVKLPPVGAARLDVRVQFQWVPVVVAVD